MKRVNIKKQIAKSFEIPLEYIDDIPKVTILGFNEVTVENYKSLIEYEKDVIRINTKGKLIKIEGNNLLINNITDEEISVTGDILCVKFD